jgi:hypothetical protein
MAEAWNSELSARAFTVGNDVAFGRGEYQPGTMRGDLLLAHELAHVTQQRGGGVSREPSRDTRLEHEADRAAASAMGLLPDEMEKYPEPGRGLRLQRCDPKKESEAKKDAAAAVGDAGSPDAATPDAGTKEPAPGGNMAHRSLSAADKAAITTLSGVAAPSSTPTFSKDGPRFVLHDTGVSFGGPKAEASHLARAKAEGSTPVGEGPAAYVNPSGVATQAHPRFFNQARPTATEFEKGNELIDQFTRETTMQAIWSATSTTEQDAVISRFLGLFPGMSAKDIKDETAKAKENLDAAKTQPTAPARGKSDASPVVFTTATGAISAVCDDVDKSVPGIAKPGKEKTLADDCAKMKPVFDARKVRIPDTTNLEIIRETGTDCSTGKGAKPFAPYDPKVYEAVAVVYLTAALEAGQFPQITTHYFLDSTATKSQNRCDPRCFDLDRLYAEIAHRLGHPAGTTYGVPPLYGTKWGMSTVWWHTPVCGAVPGAAPPVPPKPGGKSP